MSKIIPAPFDIDDYELDELIQHFVEARKEWTEDKVEYIEELIESLEFLKVHYMDKKDD